MNKTLQKMIKEIILKNFKIRQSIAKKNKTLHSELQTFCPLVVSFGMSLFLIGTVLCATSK